MNARRIIKRSPKVTTLLGLVISTLALTTPQNPALADHVNQVDAQDEVVRVNTNLVTVPATVMDRDGRYITDLKKDDFQIFEDGVEQEVAFFGPVEQPFTILFLLDVSSSMTPNVKDLTRAANAFVGELRPDDRLSAVSFDDWVKVLFQFTKVSDLRKDIKLRPGNSTWLYDAVGYALKHMKRVRGRKAIVLFSDGIDSRDLASPRGNLREAEEQDTLIYTVQFSASFWSPFAAQNEKGFHKSIEVADNYMRDLAQRTGGRRYEVENILDLSKTFGEVADELRRQYSLGYYPKRQLAVGQRRQIKVKVRIPNLVVQARDSYIVDQERVKAK